MRGLLCNFSSTSYDPQAESCVSDKAKLPSELNNPFKYDLLYTNGKGTRSTFENKKSKEAQRNWAEHTEIPLQTFSSYIDCTACTTFIAGSATGHYQHRKAGGVQTESKVLILVLLSMAAEFPTG